MLTTFIYCCRFLRMYLANDTFGLMMVPQLSNEAKYTIVRAGEFVAFKQGGAVVLTTVQS